MPTPQSRLKWLMQTLGPGMAVAATGVGAGDLVAASVAGAKFGTAVLWAAVVGALLKFAVNEGIARWQLATQTTLLEGWTQKLHRSISVYFLVYLVLWSFFVAGALISACGLAGYSLFGFGSVQGWGIVHSIAAAAFVYWGRYRYFETMMKFFIGLMFMAIILCAALILPEVDGVLYGLVLPSLPAGSTKFIFGVIGGVGGSVTLLSYGYWIREKSWLGSEHHTRVRVDLITAYALTGIFGVAVMIIAAGVSPQVATGTGIVLALADRLAEVLGPTGKWVFLVGFWGAVFSSMLGVWQGVPYLFADFLQAYRGQTPQNVRTDSKPYRWYLLYLAFPPMLVLIFGRPVWIIVLYSILGALFMPFLAATLLILNNRREWVQSFRNGLWMNLLLILSLVLFAYLGWNQLVTIR
ncbi:MAG: Nramp family divalent metal transporter [candidate division KSB1 bacterium]|nr:Nramp family divalent metal transporter [candidate division KSB1 bacterium]